MAFAKGTDGGGTTNKKKTTTTPKPTTTTSLASKYGALPSIAQTAKDTAQGKQTVTTPKATTPVTSTPKPTSTGSTVNPVIKSSYTPTASVKASSSYTPSTSKKPTASTSSNSKKSSSSSSKSSTPTKSNSKTSTSQRYPSVTTMAKQYRVQQEGAAYRDQKALDKKYGLATPSPAQAAKEAAEAFAAQRAQQTARTTATLTGQPMAAKPQNLPFTGGVPTAPQNLPYYGQLASPTAYVQNQAQQLGATNNNPVATQADVVSGAAPKSPYTPAQQVSSNNAGYVPTGNAGTQGTPSPSVGQPQPTMEMPQQPTMPEIPAWQQAPQQQVEQSAMDVGSIFDQIANLGNSYKGQSDEHAAAVAAQYTQMVDMLDQLEAQITGQIRSQMNGDDPGLQAAIGVIKEEAMRMRDEALEELNARGLVQSGVYAESLDRLNKNELTAIQQTVAGQFSDLQSQLNNALMSLAQARIGALGNSQNQLNNMLISDRQTQANIGLQGIGYGLEAQQQSQQNQQYYAGLQQQWGMANMEDATKRYGIDTGNALQQQQIDNSYKVGMANANSGGSGTSAAMLNYGLDRDMFEYNKTQQQQAQTEGYYAQMSQELQGLTSNNQLSPDQKRAMVSNSRYPDEVKQWALNQLNVIYPPVNTTTQPTNNFMNTIRSGSSGYMPSRGPNNR